MPSDKVEVEPCFVVAALIIREQAQDITENREGTMKPYLPQSIGFRRLKKPTHVSPIARNRSGSPQWCGARSHRQNAVSKGLLNDANIVAVVASPCTTIEVTSNQVHIFFEHHCTNCKDELLSSKQYTSHVTFFSCLCALVRMSHTTLAQSSSVCARHLIHVSCA